MLDKWRATQSNQDILCQSLIENLKESQNQEGQCRPKPFCAALIHDLEKLMPFEQGIKNDIFRPYTHIIITHNDLPYPLLEIYSQYL